MRVALFSTILLLNLGLTPVPTSGGLPSFVWIDHANAQSVGDFAERRLDTVPRPARGPFEYAEPEGVFPTHTVRHWLSSRTYHTYVGYHAQGEEPRPTVLLLHGSGRTGASMIDMWRRVADDNDLVLIAPDNASGNHWSSFSDSSGLLESVLEDAAATYPVDRERLYIFGHSAGAMYAAELAGDNALGALAFGAHAGFPNAVGRGSSDVRAPVAFFLGEHDHLFSVADAREIGRSLAANGHEVTLAVMPNHGHWYYTDGPAINRDAWRFFARHRAPLTQ